LSKVVFNNGLFHTFGKPYRINSSLYRIFLFTVIVKPSTSAKLSPTEVHSYDIVANFHHSQKSSQRSTNDVRPTQGIVLLAPRQHSATIIKNKNNDARNAKKRTDHPVKPKPGNKRILEINPKPIVSKHLHNSTVAAIKEQTHLTEPIHNDQNVPVIQAKLQNNMYNSLQQPSYYPSPVDMNYYNTYPQQNVYYPMNNPAVNMFQGAVSTKDQPTVSVRHTKPCVPTATNICPTAPVNLVIKASQKKEDVKTVDGAETQHKLELSNHTKETSDKKAGVKEQDVVAEMQKQQQQQQQLNQQPPAVTLTDNASEKTQDTTHSAHGGKLRS